MLGLGSSLEEALAIKNNKLKNVDKPLFVWGMGFMWEEDSEFYVGNEVAKPYRFARKVNIKATRGKFSRERVERYTNKKFNNLPLGDIGLLISKALPISVEKKKYSAGIVGHLSERRDPALLELNREISNSRIIDIYCEPTKFIKELLECEVVLSTALHPLVACCAYGIPHQWISISEGKVSKYKIRDFYSAFNKDAKCVDILKDKITNETIKEIKDNYDINMVEVENLQQGLLKCNPYSQTIRLLTRSEIKRLEKDLERELKKRQISLFKLAQRIMNMLPFR